MALPQKTPAQKGARGFADCKYEKSKTLLRLTHLANS
jgi:hypothetical protein